jgi:hypothetical protein
MPSSYPFKGQQYTQDEPGGPLAGHLIMGLLPIIGVPYLIGQYLHHREVKMAQRKKELEAAYVAKEKEIAAIDRLLLAEGSV